MIIFRRKSLQTGLKIVKTPAKRFVLNCRSAQLKREIHTISCQQDYGISDIKDKVISFTEKLRCKTSQYGHYLYQPSSKSPILYASIFAVLLRHLMGDLKAINYWERLEWIDYISSHQCEDGLFRDPLVVNDIAETEDWWGWRHLTLLSLMSLYALGAKPKHKLNFLEIMDTPAKVRALLNTFDWKRKASYTSNRLQNYVASMQFSRDFLGETSLTDSINEALSVITERCSSASGLWGSNYESPAIELSEGVQAGYHFWLLYWYDGLEIPYPDKAVDSIINLQNSYGGFNLNSCFSSACEDIDAIQPLVYMSQNYNLKQEFQVKQAIQKAIPWMVSNFNKDGGAVFRRHVSFMYGHELMYSGRNESNLFSTWFRTLSIAYAFSHQSFSRQSNDFIFLECPGYQFKVNRSSNAELLIGSGHG